MVPQNVHNQARQAVALAVEQPEHRGRAARRPLLLLPLLLALLLLLLALLLALLLLLTRRGAAPQAQRRPQRHRRLDAAADQSVQVGALHAAAPEALLRQLHDPAAPQGGRGRREGGQEVGWG